MGHVLDTYGKPQYNDNAADPGPMFDFQAAADHAEKIGGLLKMTSAQRLDLTSSQVRIGWMVSETDTGEVYVRVADGGWKVVSTPDSGFVELTKFGPGWSATAGYKPWVRRVGNRVEIGGAITRETTAGALATLVEIPVGFRITNPDYPSKFVGAGATSTNQAVMLFYNTSASHYLQINNIYMTNPPLGSGATIPLSGFWYVD